MDTVSHLTEILSGIIHLLVDAQEEVRVLPMQDSGNILFVVKIPERELGKVIGRTGRTARAIRTLFQAISMTQRVPIALNFVSVEHSEGQEIEACVPRRSVA